MTTANTEIDNTARFGVEYRAPNTTRWVLLGTVGTYDAAMSWMARFAATGSFRIRKPRPEVAQR